MKGPYTCINCQTVQIIISFLLQIAPVKQQTNRLNFEPYHSSFHVTVSAQAPAQFEWSPNLSDQKQIQQIVVGLGL